MSVTTVPSFTFSSPAPVQAGALTENANSPRNYDILPNGRFIGIVPGGTAQVGTAVPQIQVVINWFEDLKQRVPVH